jgi:hypothetical protein
MFHVVYCLFALKMEEVGFSKILVGTRLLVATSKKTVIFFPWYNSLNCA